MSIAKKVKLSTDGFEILRPAGKKRHLPRTDDYKFEYIEKLKSSLKFR